jgi:hypothetical protein
VAGFSYMESYPTAVQCTVYPPLGSWNMPVRSILISDDERVCPAAADRLHGDVHSLGNDDKLERPAI